MIDSIVAEGDEAIANKEKLDETLPIEKEVSMSLKVKKVMPLDTTMYSCCYVGLLKANKKKYRLT